MSFNGHDFLKLHRHNGINLNFQTKINSQQKATRMDIYIDNLPLENCINQEELLSLPQTPHLHSSFVIQTHHNRVQFRRNNGDNFTVVAMSIDP